LRVISQAAAARAPLCVAAVAFCLGILADSITALPTWCYTCAAVAAASLLATRTCRNSLGLALAIAGFGLFGAVSHARTTSITSAGNLNSLLPSHPSPVRIRGRIASRPVIRHAAKGPFSTWSHFGATTGFLLDIESIRTSGGFCKADGRLQVRIGEAVNRFRRHDQVEIVGMVSRLRDIANPGETPWSDHLRRAGTLGTMFCKYGEQIKHRDASAIRDPGIVERMRDAAQGLLTGATSGGDSSNGLLEAMVLGHRSKLDPQLSDTFVGAGAAHFVAVSGLHLAIPMAFTWWLARLFGLRSRYAAMAMLCVVILYVAIAESRPPILRAGVVAVLFCGSLILERRRSTLNWLALAALLILMVAPRQLFAVGFQLSFVAVLGILSVPRAVGSCRVELSRWIDVVILGNPFRASDRAVVNYLRLTDRNHHRWRHWASTMIRRIRAPLAVSLAAWISCLPVVAYHFGVIHPWSPAIALILMPWTFALVLLGLASLAAEFLIPGSGSLLEPVLAIVESGLTALVTWCAELPGSAFHVQRPTTWWLAGYYGTWIALGLALQVRKVAISTRHIQADQGAERRPPIPAFINPGPLRGWQLGVIPILALMLFLTWPAAPQRQAGILRVTVLFVGAGSSTVLEMPDGKVFLYDCGGGYASDVGRHVVLPFLRHRGIREIDGAFISHANLDHYNGLPTVCANMPVAALITNELFLDSADGGPARVLLALTEAAGTPHHVVPTGARTWTSGGAKFEMLDPWGDLPVKEVAADLGANDASMVLRVTYAGRSILLTGDIEERAQSALLRSCDLKSDILFLPHHGSMERTTRALIRAASPEVAIRSSHQRMDETLSGLVELLGHLTTYNTADDGAIVIEIESDGSFRIDTPCRHQPVADSG
jgi:competence protein ComEC